MILGAGAVGGAVGGRLALAGEEVVLIARGAQLEALRAGGLRLLAPDGAWEVAPPVVAHPAELSWRPGDTVLLATKTQDAAAALVDLATCAPPNTPVACLTNGLEAERLALRWFERVHGVYVWLPASFLSPGTVELWFTGTYGCLDPGLATGGTDDVDAALTAAFARAGFRAAPRPDVMRWKRGKLVSNVANAVEALAGPDASDSDLAHRARAEARAVFAAAGLPLPSHDEERARHHGLTLGTIAGRARGGGSTWQSLARDAGSAESDYLNGEIARLGREHGVPTPVNVGLQRAIAWAVGEGLGPGALTLAELAARVGA
ncbi:MAG: hypothetical protein KC635_03550 [Myxococcales bacterium]|nr:hypothetical protein [Myxococcales bacterium]